MSGHFTITINSVSLRADVKCGRGPRAPRDAVGNFDVTSINEFKGTVDLEYEAENYTPNGDSSVYLTEGETVNLKVGLQGSGPSTLIVTGTTATQMASDSKNFSS